MRYALLICYDGTNYGGWQIQPNAPTVQGELTRALESVMGCPINVNASGRTDSGVHAAAQVCHFDCDTTIPPEKIADALNPLLPEDISVLYSCLAPEGFDSMSSAKKKTYCYRVYLSSRPNPLKERYSTKFNMAVDMQKLENASKMFEGEHDFKAFCAAGSQVKTTVRTIYEIKIVKNFCRESEDIEIYVTGNGFLYNMVRTLAGTLLYYAAGKLSLDKLKSALYEGNREDVGKTMPAKGLTLEKVEYGVKLFNI
jgi:tRNA pseudouridine38-40 synthase